MASSAWLSLFLGSFRTELCLALALVQQLESRGGRLAHDPPGNLLHTYLTHALASYFLGEYGWRGGGLEKRGVGWGGVRCGGVKIMCRTI